MHIFYIILNKCKCKTITYYADHIDQDWFYDNIDNIDVRETSIMRLLCPGCVCLRIVSVTLTVVSTLVSIYAFETVYETVMELK